MMDKFVALTPEVYRYLVSHRSDQDPVLNDLAAETAALGNLSLMQVAPEQGALMALLARAIGARHAVEVGTFTGYSALCVARALPDGGRLLCCDISEEWTSLGKPFWERAGVAHKIDLRIGPALDTLQALEPVEQFDFGFIDADKPSYAAYYEEVLLRLRPNGLILFDNVLWMGEVANPYAQDEETNALRALNDRIATDPRVESVMVPVADGLTIVRKRRGRAGD